MRRELGVSDDFAMNTTRSADDWVGEVQHLLVHGRDREAAELAARQLRDAETDPDEHHIKEELTS